MAKDLAAWAKKNGVKYFAISFTDLFGAQRAKLVPTAAIADMQASAAAMGANAVVGVDIDYEVVGARGSILMATACGTAVVLE